MDQHLDIISSWNQLGSDPNVMNSLIQQYENSLKQLETCDDPIELYIEYLEYIKREPIYQEKLLQILEKATHDFKDDEIYKNDVRYLRIWLQYVQFSDSPLDVYLYLFKKQIGAKLGLFYQSFANHLEQRGDMQKCYEVYQFSLDQRFLRNLTTLRSNFQHFEQRLINYEKFGGPIDRNKKSFLSNLDSKKHSLESVEASQIKRSKPQSNLYLPSHQVMEISGKPSLKCQINLSLIYTENGEEFTPEEILCMERGIYDKLYTKMQTKRSTVSKGLTEKSVTSVIPLKDVTNEQISTKNHPKYALDDVSSSPTMTMITKEANDEILSIFNKPIEELVDEEVKSNSPLPAAKSFKVRVDLEDELPKNLNLEHEDHEELDIEKEKEEHQKHQQNEDEVYELEAQENEHVPCTPPRDNLVSSGDSSVRRTNLVPFMTPIAEVSESNTRHTLLMSSPFIENPHPQQIHQDFSAVINPLDDHVRSLIIRNAPRPLTSYENYSISYKSMNKLPTLKQFFKSKTSKALVGNKNSMLDLGDELYCVRKKLGEGGYASVYLCESSSGSLDAVKIEKPSSPWEFYILKQIESRTTDLESIIKAKRLHLFEDEGYLILEYLDKGTLLDLVNHYRNKAESLDERLIISIMVELVNTICSLHRHQIIHGDLKPDNCMLNITDTSCVKIIDFGRAIDLAQLPHNIRFKANWETDNQDCPEMRKNETWVYEIDYFGLANILHTLLFQEPIEISEANDSYILRKSIKRYWIQEWNELFDILINSSKHTNILNELDVLTLKLQKYIENSKVSLREMMNRLQNEYHCI